jgi:hypothetical protein
VSQKLKSGRKIVAKPSEAFFFDLFIFFTWKNKSTEEKCLPRLGNYGTLHTLSFFKV